MPVDESESSLVARAARRDHDAFSQLYTLYFDRVYRYVRLKVGNAPDAEDVTATIFLSAWRTIDNFSPKHDLSFAAWLFRLAHNALVDRYRRTRDVVSLDDVTTDATIIHTLVGVEQTTPEEHLEWKTTLDELREALYTLTAEQREVVLLRFVEGLSAREVGKIMGKQQGTVRGMQFRAIEALRKALTHGKEGPRHER